MFTQSLSRYKSRALGTSAHVHQKPQRMTVGQAEPSQSIPHTDASNHKILWFSDWAHPQHWCHVISLQRLYLKMNLFWKRTTDSSADRNRKTIPLKVAWAMILTPLQLKITSEYIDFFQRFAAESLVTLLSVFVCNKKCPSIWYQNLSSIWRCWVEF